MTKIASMILAGTLLVGTASGAQTFTGVITDLMCGKDHAAMKVSPESKCVTECAKAGYQYALYDGKNLFTLSDQEAPAKYAAQKVKVIGTMNAQTKVITVQSIQPAK